MDESTRGVDNEFFRKYFLGEDAICESTNGRYDLIWLGILQNLNEVESGRVFLKGYYIKIGQSTAREVCD